ncbi:MAG TPA: hypothetical protein VGC67_01520 [Cellulomonas sp.]
MRGLAALLGAILVLATMGLTACSREACLPADLQLSGSDLAGGAAVTVSSDAAACDLALDQGTTYELTFVAADESWPLGDVEPAADGQFSVEVTVPHDAPDGRASIDVTGSPYDECRDTGSCVGYQVDLRVGS